MSFLLKCLLISVACIFTNCSFDDPQELKTNLQIDTLPQSASKPVEIIDTISHLKYAWLNEIAPEATLKNRIKPPRSFHRIQNKKGSFGDWLSHLPLKSATAKVHLFNGDLKSDQSVHSAVVDIDVGSRDLQQCADAVMRLRAEYFYGLGDYSKIHFNYTSGDEVAFADWRFGKKPIVSGNSVKFSNKTNKADDSYPNFRKYLNAIFSYAGTASLSKEMQKIALEDMQIGDVFIQGGFPGHAIIVVDMAENEAGARCFLLAQSYMPAQEIHILKNFNNPDLSPWYSTKFGDELQTPEWTFAKNDLKRFVD